MAVLSRLPCLLLCFYGFWFVCDADSLELRGHKISLLTVRKHSGTGKHVCWLLNIGNTGRIWRWTQENGKTSGRYCKQIGFSLRGGGNGIYEEGRMPNRKSDRNPDWYKDYWGRRAAPCRKLCDGKQGNGFPCKDAEPANVKKPEWIDRVQGRDSEGSNRMQALYHELSTADRTHSAWSENVS